MIKLILEKLMEQTMIKITSNLHKWRQICSRRMEELDRFSYLRTARHVFFVYVCVYPHTSSGMTHVYEEINNHLRCENFSQKTLLYYWRK